MRKVVAESLNEYWTSTSTVADLYADYAPAQQEGPKSINPEDFKEMVPPPTMKLSPDDFDNYVSELISFIPQSPGIAIQLFKTTLLTHPYLRRKPVGFNRINPYEQTINKFIEAFKALTRG